MCFSMSADSENLGTAAVERELRTATGDSERLLLTPVGENLFRVEESLFITDAVYRDVIRATETQDSALLFVEITERSPLVTNSWILSQELIQSDAVRSVLKQVTDQGGNWEQVFGGGLIVHTFANDGQGNRRTDTSDWKSENEALRRLMQLRLAPPRHSGPWVGAPVASLRCRTLRPGEVSINRQG